jgi:hypothetical protein
LQLFLRIITDSKHLYLLKGLPTAQQQYQTLKVHLDLGTYAQIYFSARNLITMKFTTYEDILASFTSYTNQMSDAGITTFREALPYLFMGLISPYYDSAIMNVLTDTPESLKTSDWTLEAVGRYFGLKRPSRLPPQTEKDPKKASDRQSRQPATTTSTTPATNTSTTTATNTSTDSEKQNRSTYHNRPTCATCVRKHLGICKSKDWNPYTDKQPEKSAELPAQDLSKGFYAIKSANSSILSSISSAWWIDSDAIYTLINNKAWFIIYKECELDPIQIGDNNALPAVVKGTVKLSNELVLHDVRHMPAFAINIIALADLRAYRPAYDWKNAEWLLNIGNDTIRVAEESRLWPIYAQSTTEQQNHKQQMTSEQQKISEQETSKQQKTSEQKTFEQQTPIPRMSGALISRSGKQLPRRQLRRSKRAQPLWQWHQRLGHLNYEDVKQLESHNFDVKLSNGKTLFCELCTLGKQHAIPSHEP